MAKKVFIWSAHPRAGSLSDALADAYAMGAEQGGAEVRQLNLSAMTFSADFPGYTDTRSPLEPDLKAWQDNIAWADHLLFVHPYWWGAMPGRAKAVLDRALLPGFGFKYHREGLGWDKLLKGKTADTIITSDTPPWYDTLRNRKPGRRVLKNQVLGFCGVKVRKIIQLGPVKTSKPTKIEGWIARAQRMGAKAAI
ncbi:NAD(P)H-dependent oxidoreductase [Parasphingopyxis lamellibrachiae]|uniref:Putative NADPH-quinone reductase n=1 Tax=Parasphingopyxis lamellibrachiae TaxID=680125 RepID=A0A3D9FC10_9SPHN|nr:NAD(P)H-dependent oxidoreductase [Parasphingopyxis lamellibrachiae]RED15132.1 putative NADPH-quinone reductase [Parasphingopyxis lamellibrachiae]